MKENIKFNKLTFGISKLIIVAAVLLFANGCRKENTLSFQEPKRQTLMLDVLKQDTSLTMAIAALEKAKMAPTLNTYGPFTFFVPDNNAFKKYFKNVGKTGLDEFTEAELKTIMTYHILPTRLKSASFLQGPQTVTTGNKDYITLDISKGFKTTAVANGKATVYSTDMEVSNGLIHKMDAVLDPPTLTIGQFLTLNADQYSIMIGGLKRAGLMDTLTNLENDRKERIRLTLFAETNAVLEKAGITSFDNVPIEELIKQMRYHIITGSNFSSSYTPLTTSIPHLGWPERYSSVYNTLSFNEWIYFDLAAKNLINGSVNFLASDIIMKNGIIHNVDNRLVFSDAVHRIPIFHLFKDAANYGYGIPNYVDGSLAVVASGTNWRITADSDDTPAATPSSIKRTGILIIYAAFDNAGDSIISVVKGIRKGKYNFRVAVKNGGRGTVQMMYQNDLIGTPKVMNVPGTGTVYSSVIMGSYEFKTSGDKRIKFVCTATPGVAFETMVLTPEY
ncbi:MAG: fasciclin domain-containing protein [Pedobacter sp.]|nr:MAG: fasciclin domain-containing protein [Pedobacter sp.]